NAVAVQIGLDVLVVPIESEVAVELAIIGIARIADLRAPDVLAGFNIAREGGNACGRDDRSIYAAPRLRIAKHYGVRVRDEEFYPRFFEQVINACVISAFGQPDAARRAPEMFYIIAAANFDLRAASFLPGHQRQKAVSRAAGDYFNRACFLKRAKPVDEI